MRTLSNQNVARALYLALDEAPGKDFKKILRQAVFFLHRRHLFSQARDILRRVEKINDQEKGILRTRLFSARPLSGEAKNQLEHLLKTRHQARAVEFEERVDPSLLGGVRVETGDQVLDLTVRGKIKKLASHLEKNE